MIKQTESKITPSMYKRAEKMGYSMNEILTMASIIQMESGQNTDEMPSVAAVFYNRLKSKDFSTLGSSPTSYYGESFRKDDGRYNTYDIKGIPPGPLCSPGLAAINAALNPSDGMDGIFYFVTVAIVFVFEPMTFTTVGFVICAFYFVTVGIVFVFPCGFCITMICGFYFVTIGVVFVFTPRLQNTAKVVCFFYFITINFCSFVSNY